jgi:hypothetical protein
MLIMLYYGVVCGMVYGMMALLFLNFFEHENFLETSTPARGTSSRYVGLIEAKFWRVCCRAGNGQFVVPHRAEKNGT